MKREWKPMNAQGIRTWLRGIALALAFVPSAVNAIEWKLANIIPPDHPANHAVTAAAKKIEEKTSGRIQIKVYPAGQIGSAKEIITGMTVGTVQMALDGPGILSQWSKRLSVLEAPYLAKDFAHLRRIVDSPEGQKLYDELRQRHKIRLLDVWYYGSRHLTNSKRPINSVADTAGLKLRVPEIALSLEWARALGMSPTPMAFPELYLSLQTGVVDGQENPLPTINSAKFYEVQKHLALTGHLVSMISPLVAEDSWNAANEADRKVVIEAFKAAGVKYNAQIDALESELVKSLETKGMQVTRPDQEAMRKAMVPVYTKFEEAWGKGTYAALAAIP
jgi:tripartite ATP-independent transporter DctP family solute receptor